MRAKHAKPFEFAIPFQCCYGPLASQVIEGDQVTIYPGGDETAAMAVPIAPGAGIPAPMSAPPFASHTLMNSGTKPLKMLFFEAKK